MPLLHGVLHGVVHEATDLRASRRIQAVGCLKRYVCCGMLPELAGSCDPYLCLDVGGTRRLRSTFIQGTHNPVWNERFAVDLADEAEELKIEVKDADVVGADFLGMAVIPVSAIIGGQQYDEWLPLTDLQGAPMSSKDIHGHEKPSRVHISLKYVPAGSQLQDGGNELQNEVPRAYFPLRQGNKVTLYHDAVCTPGPVPGLKLGNGSLYSESSCWDDIFHAINKAERFIFITGWSVWAQTMLKRTPTQDFDSPSIGDMLIKKAEQGVNVLMLCWDDQTNNLGLHSGLMGTHDEATFAFFKGTKVTCLKCPRQGGSEDSYLQSLARQNMFTHHQKTVILDTPIPGAKADPSSTSPTGITPTRRVMAFVGGLDLTNGRWDTWDHPLYETCCPGGPHHKDYYQNCVDGREDGKPCPRQPWHDIHALVEGPIAMDVAINFMERWSKQAGARHLHKLAAMGNYRDILLPEALRTFASKKEQLKGQVRGHISLRLDAIKNADENMALPDIPQGEAWGVQLFRSIDSDSAEGFPTSSEGAYEAGLTIGKGKTVDASIHRAYVHLIRNAKRYLYLENQYFLGSAHLWDSDTDTPCYNQVPAEIALKIVSKIKAGEPFRVYVCIPMYPEGVPTSGSVQAILYFQAKTREMMYKRIAKAIEEAGLKGKAHPQDYLQFFCLGKREGHETGDGCGVSADELLPVSTPANGTAPEQPANGTSATPPAGSALGDAKPAAPQGTLQARAHAARRMMIYVHSKLMVVDDEYVVVGSANINQRSLDGSRDSEICIGAFQDGHVMASAAGPLPQGEVAGFRKALWMEHLGSLLAEADDPSDVRCMRTLTRLGNENWAAYVADAPAPLPHGHLMTYPSWCDAEGAVLPLPDCDEFPDLGGKIMGTKSTVLPGILTS